MTLKLHLFFALLVFTTIEAKLFKDIFQKNHLRFASGKDLPQKAAEHLRKRRDIEDNTTSDETSELDATKLLQFFLAAAWEGDKTEVIGSFIEDMTDTDTNITIIGWQRLLDAEGKIEELHTIQLVIPPKPEDPDAPNNIVNDDDDDDEDGFVIPHDDINEMKEIFDPMAAIGMPACITEEKFDSDGENEELIYMDKDQLYVHAEGFSAYNKTAVVDAKEVSDFIASLKPGIFGKPAVLKYDVDGHLIPDQSHIRAQYLGDVLDYYDVPDNILIEAPQIVAEVAYQYPREESAKQLAIRYNKAYPEYKWKVILDPEYYHVKRDVLLLLSYDNFDFDENSDISYLVYGVKKNTNTK